MTDDVLATVAILTYNGERYLDRILGAVSRQEVDGEVDILVVDSGSTDDTLDIVRRFPRVRLHQIPNEEFGHGRTRNLAASLSRGEFTAFLTHDAIPLSPRWLDHLVAPMRADSRVGGVTGKQVPRPGCFPLLKYEIRGVFAHCGVDWGVTVFSRDWVDPEDPAYARATFYSDVNSAARTAVLREAVPYRDLAYAEDQAFGRDLLEAGYRKAYAPAAAVEHSNDLSLREYGMRIYDETVGLRGAGEEILPRGYPSAFAHAAVGAARDALRILRDREYSFVRKVFWWAVNPWYHLRKWTSYSRASRAALGDDPHRSRRSLESSRRRRKPDPRP